MIQSSFAHQKHNGTCVALKVKVAASSLYIELSSNSAPVAGQNKCVRFTLSVREVSFTSCDDGETKHVCMLRSKIVGQYLEYQ